MEGAVKDENGVKIILYYNNLLNPKYQKTATNKKRPVCCIDGFSYFSVTEMSKLWRNFLHFSEEHQACGPFLFIFFPWEKHIGTYAQQ